MSRKTLNFSSTVSIWASKWYAINIAPCLVSILRLFNIRHGFFSYHALSAFVCMHACMCVCVYVCMCVRRLLWQSPLQIIWFLVSTRKMSASTGSRPSAMPFPSEQAQYLIDYFDFSLRVLPIYAVHPSVRNELREISSKPRFIDGLMHSSSFICVLSVSTACHSAP